MKPVFLSFFARLFDFFMLLITVSNSIKTSISNHGLALDFTVKVLVGETGSIADKNVVTKSW